MDEDIKGRLLAALADVGAIQKDAKNDHHGYSYLSENAVKEAAHAAQVAHGVMPDAILLDVLKDEWVPGTKNRMRNMVSARVTLHFGEGRYQGAASGVDYDDKALTKAQTGALREAWKGLFTIATGQDPEADNSASVREDAPGLCLPNMKWLDDDAGKPISEVSDSVLTRYAEWQRPKIKDDKFKKKNLALLDAIDAVLASRTAWAFPNGEHKGRKLTDSRIPKAYLSEAAQKASDAGASELASLIESEIERRDGAEEEQQRDPIVAGMAEDQHARNFPAEDVKL